MRVESERQRRHHRDTETGRTARMKDTGGTAERQGRRLKDEVNGCRNINETDNGEAQGLLRKATLRRGEERLRGRVRIGAGASDPGGVRMVMRR